MRTFERKHNRTFDVVIKARPDMLWLNSVRPWCTFGQETAYLAVQQPLDWFFMIPRRIAKDVLSVPYTTYQGCDNRFHNWAHDDPFKHAMMNISMDCCGGGPTAIIFAAVLAQRIRVVGPAWPPTNARIGRTGRVGAPVPDSLEIKELFPCLVVRNEDVNVWCAATSAFYLYHKRDTGWPHPMHFFPSEDICRKALDPVPLLNSSMR